MEVDDIPGVIWSQIIWKRYISLLEIMLIFIGFVSSMFFYVVCWLCKCEHENTRVLTKLLFFPDSSIILKYCGVIVFHTFTSLIIIFPLPYLISCTIWSLQTLHDDNIPCYWRDLSFRSIMLILTFIVLTEKVCWGPCWWWSSRNFWP